MCVNKTEFHYDVTFINWSVEYPFLVSKSSVVFNMSVTRSSPISSNTPLNPPDLNNESIFSFGRSFLATDSSATRVFGGANRRL